MGSSGQKEIAVKVRRTKKLIEAGKKLKEYRDRIDDIIHTINSGEDFHKDIADECVNIGVTIQGLSKILRPLSVEGRKKAAQRKIKARWKSKHNKAQKSGDSDWIAKYSKKGRYHSYGSWYEGPTQAFINEFCSDLVGEKD